MPLDKPETIQLDGVHFPAAGVLRVLVHGKHFFRRKIIAQHGIQRGTRRARQMHEKNQFAHHCVFLAALPGRLSARCGFSRIRRKHERGLPATAPCRADSGVPTASIPQRPRRPAGKISRAVRQAERNTRDRDTIAASPLTVQKRRRRRVRTALRLPAGMARLSASDASVRVHSGRSQTTSPCPDCVSAKKPPWHSLSASHAGRST